MDEFSTTSTNILLRIGIESRGNTKIKSYSENNKEKYDQCQLEE